MEWHSARFSAGSADGVEHFALRASGILAGVAARFTSLRFIRKSLFFEEILFACSEYEFLAAVFAD